MEMNDAMAGMAGGFPVPVSEAQSEGIMIATRIKHMEDEQKNARQNNCFSHGDRDTFLINLERYATTGDDRARERIAQLFCHEKVMDWLRRQSKIRNPQDREDVVVKSIEQATDGDFLRNTWTVYGDKADPVLMLLQKLRGARSDYFRSKQSLRAQNEIPLPEGREPTDTQQEGATLLGAWKQLIETNPEAVWECILKHSDDTTAQAFWSKYCEGLTDALIGRTLCIQREDVNKRIKGLLKNPDFQRQLLVLIEGE